jgi:hypothetical protein
MFSKYCLVHIFWSENNKSKLYACRNSEELNPEHASHHSLHNLLFPLLLPKDTQRSKHTELHSFLRAHRAFYCLLFICANKYMYVHLLVQINNEYRTTILPVVLYGCKTRSLT